MIDNIARALLRPEKATLEPQKAITGPGAAVMSWGIPLSSAQRNENQMMKEAQAVYARGNRWVKRAEMTISGRVGSVGWHLETDDGETIDDDSPPQLKAYRDIFEKPIGSEELARTYPGQPRTRREAWGLTSRHMGLCNVGFWYLDQIDAAMGWPQRIFMLRPDRMTPNEKDGRLVDWVLDADEKGNGEHLSLEQVLPFYLDPVDKGHFGTGLVESCLATLNLPNAIDRHALDSLGSGGRLAGLYAPKEGATDDQFERLMTDLRVVKDMPDSAKRDIVARMPIDFTPTAADMTSLSVIAVSQMSRDDVLTHWGVPLSTIGGQSPAGLNSGGSREYDEAALWQNAVQFRIDSLYETIQFRLLDRLQAIGLNLRLVIDVPEFDDETPMYDLAEKAISLPLRNVERRAILGLDPFGDPALDNAVWMPINLTELALAPAAAGAQPPRKEDPQLSARDAEAVGVLIRAGFKPEDALRQLGLPAIAHTGLLPVTLQVEKAKLSPLKPVIDRLLPRMQKDLRAFLDAQKHTLAQRIGPLAGHLSKKPTDSVWWNGAKWDAELRKVLAPYAHEIANLTAERTSASLGSGKAEPFSDLAGNAVLQRLLERLGTRIKGINETTREQIARTIKEGVEAGDGAAQLGDRIEALTGLDEYRAELIARTESARVLNEAQIESFREYGVAQVRAIDGDEDPECAARDGQTFPLDEALDIADHPNGTLDWVPVI